MIKVRLETVKKFIVFLCFMALSAWGGYLYGQNELKVFWKEFRPSLTVTNKLPKNPAPSDFSLFWGVWDRVSALYFDKTKLDSQKMVYGAISGMVSAIGDPYTVFLPPKENKESMDGLNGNFEGIGAQLGEKDERIIVVAPVKGSPAMRAGLKSGDWIYKVNGEETREWSVVKAVSKIRGPRGTEVKLTIVRQGAEKPLDFSIIRDTINIPSIVWEEKTASVSGRVVGKYTYLSLSRFGQDTDAQWDEAILAVSKIKNGGLILDLRNNTGGLLDSAVHIAEDFLQVGKLVVSQKNYNGSGDDFSVERKGLMPNGKMVVLVNEGSASAAEILAGALQAHKRARLVGEKTFGKGSVQQVIDLNDGSGLHVTVSKWLLPNGVWIDKAGLIPDIKVEFQEGKDLQLEKAIETLYD